ncbi:hypothetical protein H112_03942 [Trichophyton rubrum D6]|uniref:Uncharacterized protein n=2 Tax=Trichophyton TaxID=5550 RepID=A0A022W4J6_TRIRU|nr:hypothetical protein H100_03950 [Trichophyton rubrum MR850]EZF42357.1 hypothetical protein H102_03937 [Trichophyton rubrum CBS 100081]EZF53277.1 hypothetical protein H103_03952 [Trichophyton rubrum CBS 288.86]EZF63661.1 hypothetical protein H104_03937 [Trichophyton rubrum CBS 289.86]EZF74265.1 hypothetical protein H105_03965 [Trichophyton soudanense CBS 452.61]EZF84987.1 hypothetical protein H110_03944 [Trichophyton rubrum MR1448]EZF95689.1 hypothetical protein H113_03977 [Trichophyton rub
MLKPPPSTACRCQRRLRLSIVHNAFCRRFGCCDFSILSRLLTNLSLGLLSQQLQHLQLQLLRLYEDLRWQDGSEEMKMKAKMLFFLGLPSPYTTDYVPRILLSPNFLSSDPPRLQRTPRW